jgi:hypothetical protein
MVVVLMGLAFGFGPEGRIAPMPWGTGLRLAFAAALGGALFAAFYDRKNLPKKAFDFSPRRGLQYFLMGWLLFPIALLWRWGMRDMDFSVADLAAGTLVMSLLIGIVGTFTENSGI